MGRGDRAGPDGIRGGHLPGARFVDVDRDLAGPASPQEGRHPLPAPAAFAAAMARVGISDGDDVIAYDGGCGVIAARMVWMLRALGECAAVLNGGLARWSGDLETGAGPVVLPGRFSERPWPAERLASVDEAAGAGASSEAALIDGRPADRFAGAPNALDPRPGHVPGARSLPAFENCAEDGGLLGEEVLAGRFAAAGVAAGTPFVSMCGSGIVACHNLLLAEQLGFTGGRLYPGSWSQYAADPGRPVEIG